MTAKEKWERAKKLYDERAKSGAFWNERERANFRRRVRRLAKSVNVRSDHPDELKAVLYLDSIATREGIDLEFINRL